ncbi:MAG: transporter [Blastococcus sp.]|jgi:MFS family permease|nr:transporter [Blastococcus sp.]
MRRDTLALVGGATTFSLALGIPSVALPLLALDAGYSGVEVGILVALSSVTQVLARIGMGGWMNRYSDRSFVLASMVLLGVSNLLAAVSVAVVPFVLAHLMQGVARAFFWTGTQTHAVRGDRSAVDGLALVNLASAAGLLLGPVLAGTIGERSLPLAIGVGAACALVGLVPALALDRLPPFQPPKGRTRMRIWRRPGVDAGCWSVVSAGAIRGLLGSYVPVALDGAQLSTSVIGVLISTANGAQLAGTAVVTRFGTRGQARLLVAAALAAGAGMAVIGVVAEMPLVAAVALALTGLGMGVLQTAGPAVASDAVHPEERGAVMATTGTFRSAAMLAAPLAAAGVVAVASVPLALLVGGLIIAAPVRASWRLARRLDDGPAPS